MPSYRQKHSSFVVRDKLYIFGGKTLDGWSKYDKNDLIFLNLQEKHGSWMTIKLEIDIMKSRACYGESNGHLIIYGGYIYLNR